MAIDFDQKKSALKKEMSYSLYAIEKRVYQFQVSS